MKRSLTTICCLCVAFAAGADAEDLSLGRTVAGSLEQDGRHEHFVELDAAQFVYGEVDQLDVDVKVTVFDPRGDIVGSFDGPARGAEAITLETGSAGRFRIEVAADDEQSGDYTLTLQRIEAVATDPAQRVDQLLSAFTGDDVPGGIVAVYRDGEVVHTQAVGMANLSHGLPFERKTVSNIASVSKQFTAFAVVTLAHSGSFSLDDDVRGFLPDLPDLGETVTLRHLLNHTSGYREFLCLLGMTGLRLERGDYIDRDELIGAIQRQTALQEKPGTEYNYNNTGYGLAALLVEEVTGMPFARWMAENVFEPLGMLSTRVRSHVGEIIPSSAQGYVFAKEAPFREATDLGGGGGASMGPGAVYTTVDDLARWIDNLHTAKLGGPEVLGEMTRHQIEAPGENNYYGLGLSLSKHRGLALVQHSGADTAHRAQLLYYPDINAAVVTLSNNGAFPGSIARKTAEAFFAEHMEPKEDAEVGRVVVDPGVFDPYLGKYELEDFPGVVVSIMREDQTLLVQFPGADKQPVSAVSRTSLSLPPDTTIEFNVEEDGSVGSLTFKGPNELRARRLEDWTPEAEELSAYVGRYFSAELETFYTVELGEKGLVVKHRRLDDIELTPKVTDSFNGGFPLAEVVFTRSEGGELTGMTVSSERTRGVRFERTE
jgi:CubicO group peptidase (beta-lactamase class C family)